MFSKAFFGRKQELSLIALTVASIVTPTRCLSKYLYQRSVCGTEAGSPRADQLSDCHLAHICCTKPGHHSFLPVF